MNNLNLLLLIFIAFACYLSNTKYEKFIITKKTIAFSLTCHEAVDCVIDLFENIKYNFSDEFNYIILISTNDTINNLLKEKELDYNIKIITVRDDSLNIWSNIELFHQHMLNAKYLLDNNIDFDYFWFVASNEYFIKKVTQEYINKNIIKYTPKKTNLNIDESYEKIYDKLGSCMWLNTILSDQNLITYFKKNNIELHKNHHEGTILDKKLAVEIMNFYFEGNINSSIVRNYPLEEYFIPSYINSKYNITSGVLANTIIWIYHGFSNGYDAYNNYINDPNVIALKPVTRNYDDPLRKLIRDKQV